MVPITWPTLSGGVEKPNVKTIAIMPTADWSDTAKTLGF
jgi:hypothetical protein